MASDNPTDPEAPVVVTEPEAVTDLEPVQAKTIQATLSAELAAKAEFTLNLRTEVLTVPTDRLRLRLRDFRHQLHAKSSWQAPTGILISLVAALVASDFKDRWVPAATWEALFILVAVVAAFFLLKALPRRYHARTLEDEIEDLVKKLREPQ